MKYRFINFLFFIFIFLPTYLHALSPSDAYQTALTLYKQGQYDQSIEQLKNAIQLNSNDWQAYQLLGYDYAQKQNINDALNACEKSLQINPDNPVLKQYADKLSGVVASMQTPTVPAPTAVISAQPTGIPSKPATTPVATHVELKPTTVIPQGHFYLELAGGIDVPAQNWQSAYSLGGGGKISAGYEFDKSFSIQLDVENYYFSGVNYSGPISDIEFLVLPTIRYCFSEKGIRPYLLAGVGDEFELLSAISGGLTVSNLDVVVGAGVGVQLSEKTDVFVEGRCNFIFSSDVTGQDIPLLAGVRFGI